MFSADLLLALSVSSVPLQVEAATGQPATPPPAAQSTAPAPPPAPPPTVATRPAAPMTAPPLPTPEPKDGVREHDGFYLRLALGFSGFGDAIFSKAQNDDDDPRHEGSIRGMALASEIAIGGTVAPGFVLGGGIYSSTVQASTFELVRGEVPSELQRPDSFSIIGVMGDWYFRPRSGLHAQAALGVAALTGVGPESPRVRDRRSAVGGGVMLGVGYEWWIADEWSFGILGRVTGAVTTEEDDAGDRWYHVTGAGPAVLFTATYH